MRLYIVLTVLLITGCGGGISAVKSLVIDAGLAAAEAVALYDANGDGELDTEELEACPGMLRSIAFYDLDKNDKISEEEIAARLQSWGESGPGMFPLDCRVTLDGQALVGAQVRFVPEPYLSDVIKPAIGTTYENGMAYISIAPKDLPKAHQRIRAVTAGVYKVEITHPSVKIPEKYNEQTTLGRDVSQETRVMPFEVFELTSS